MVVNPFTERSRITEPQHFAGRWSELSLIFDAIQAGRPVLVSGSPGIGKSSLLSHIADSAAANLEREDLRSYYLDLAEASSAEEVYQVFIEALGQRGSTSAALEVALLSTDAPTVLCLDNADAAIAAGWGVTMLEALARMVRGGSLVLVAAIEGAPPLLSERFAHVRLGAFAPAEIRLLAEAYLDGTGVVFTPAELRAVAELSLAHPAYVQRAAFHLFRSKLDPSYNWRAEYLAEARERPVPGAPLPPAVFEGAAATSVESSRDAGAEGGALAEEVQAAPLPEVPWVLGYLLPLLAAALLFVATASLPLALVVAAAGVALVFLWQRRR